MERRDICRPLATRGSTNGSLYPSVDMANIYNEPRRVVVKILWWWW